jgi:hypothetical protein
MLALSTSATIDMARDLFIGRLSVKVTAFRAVEGMPLASVRAL